MKPEPTLAELAEIGAKASRHWNGYKLFGNLTVNPNRSAYADDQPFREAFAKAVRDAVLDHIAESDKPDPYAELKAAHAAGKVIQIAHHNLPDVWVDFPFPEFSAPPEDYRIKPEPVIVPLDMTDLRATDEFKMKRGKTIYTLLFWDEHNVRTSQGFATYDDLAANYLRRQHGSNEWKPCTKEITK